MFELTLSGDASFIFLYLAKVKFSSSFENKEDSGPWYSGNFGLPIIHSLNSANCPVHPTRNIPELCWGWDSSRTLHSVLSLSCCFAFQLLCFSQLFARGLPRQPFSFLHSFIGDGLDTHIPVCNAIWNTYSWFPSGTIYQVSALSQSISPFCNHRVWFG